MIAKTVSITLVWALALFMVVAAGAPVQDDVATLPFEGKHNVSATIGLVDITCILKSWRLKGILVCTNGTTVEECLWVENAYPSGLLEVVRQANKTHYAEAKTVIGALKTIRPFGRSSSHVPMSGDGTTEQFVEAHAFTFVPELSLLSNLGIPLAIPDGNLFEVEYLTELDGFGWRNPLYGTITNPKSILSSLKSCQRFPDPETCAGKWGSYYPRIGFIKNSSRTSAAYMQALRAGRVASDPIGRVTLGRYDYEPRTGHYIQMLEPQYQVCQQIGSPLAGFKEKGTGSKYGNYLFLHYGIFETCRG